MSMLASQRLCLFLLAASPAMADQLTLESVADNTLYESALGNLSNGAGDGIFAGATGLMNGGGAIRRAVLRFDVAGSIPAGSTITGVRLTLECTRANSPSTVQSLHRVLADWGEGTSVAFGAGGSGAPPTPGDTTWIHTFFPGTFWTNAGGDFDASPSATQTVFLENPYDFVSPGLVLDVQNWLDGTAPDHGWMIKDDAESPGDARRWGSRESAATERPMLVIDFDPPMIGTNYCGPAVVNVGGAPAEMAAVGSTTAAANSLMLIATSLPINTAGFFIASETQGFVVGPGGSAGNLCLGGSIGRFQVQVQNSGAAGRISIPVDMTMVPTPSGPTAIVAGSTWNFQAWFRDSAGGVATSNFSDALTIQFQ